ncbi:MAG: sensor histidine kinase [Sulfurospirillaceae bacterium]|nr:sensor histidine kinase [Sulfurospirillaceae bacterium]MDD2825339.1 sensor histidine kinase [Sulfurospirillaceae bacterium]
MHQISIKKRLLGWLSYSFLGITLLVIITVYLFVNREINRYFDDTLVHESSSIIDRLYIANSHIKFKNQHLGIDLQTSLGDSSIFYSIEDTSGNLLFGFKNIPKPLKNNKQQIFYDAQFLNQKIRAFQTSYTMMRNKQSFTVIITIAETLEDRNAILYKLYFIITMITISFIVSTLAFTLIAISKGFEPLKALQNSIKKRDVHDLTPISENKIPIEVISLVQSINQLFTKLKKSFLHVEHFNQDVSHQLRTPLAELKMYIEMDESIDEKQKPFYLENINTMVHTIEQLLLHAHTNPDAFDRIQFKPFNLTELCKKIAMQKAPVLYQNGFDIAFEAEESYWINGSAVIIESLLCNLIDNAQKYARNENTIKANTITLCIKEENETIIMRLLDNGPGIPQKYLDKIYDRFFRLDTQKQGTGLGLSIVKQIVELHEGSIVLTNRKPHGLDVSITFPKYEETSKLFCTLHFSNK